MLRGVGGWLRSEEGGWWSTWRERMHACDLLRACVPACVAIALRSCVLRVLRVLRQCALRACAAVLHCHCKSHLSLLVLLYITLLQLVYHYCLPLLSCISSFTSPHLTSSLTLRLFTYSILVYINSGQHQSFILKWRRELKDDMYSTRRGSVSRVSCCPLRCTSSPLATTGNYPSLYPHLFFVLSLTLSLLPPFSPSNTIFIRAEGYNLHKRKKIYEHKTFTKQKKSTRYERRKKRRRGDGEKRGGMRLKEKRKKQKRRKWRELRDSSSYRCEVSCVDWMSLCLWILFFFFLSLFLYSQDGSY